MAREIVAVYRRREAAEATQQSLILAGIPPLRIHLHHSAADAGSTEREGRRAWQGALLGGLLGFVVGGLFTISLSFVPALSWVLASDDWASVIGGSAAGAWLGAIAGGLGARRRRPGAGEIQSLLRVDAEEQEVDRVVLLMQRCGPVRLDRGVPAGPGVERMQVAQNRPGEPPSGRPSDEETV